MINYIRSFVLALPTCEWKSPALFFGLILLSSCNGAKEDTGKGGVTTPSAPPAPTLLSLVVPGSSPGLDSTPTISVGGVVSGNTVKLFSDSACTTTEIGSGVSSGTSVNITVSSALSVSSHTIYANATNAIGTSPCSLVSVSYTLASCPANFIPVPHNSSVGTNTDFCVMKYEAKAYHSVNQAIDADGCNEAGCTTANWGLADHIPVSSSTGSPWRRINIGNASSECNSLNTGGAANYDLISNQEWMTIARNAEGVGANWEAGTPGNGAMFRGHTDNSPGSALSAAADNDPYNGTENDSTLAMGSGKEQKRTLTLSNSEVIWDLSGNVLEWVDWDLATAGLQEGPKTCAASSTELPNVSCAALSQSQYMTAMANLTSINGVGFFYGGSGGAAFRGSNWASGSSGGVFMLSLNFSTSFADSIVGFRCVYRP
jgi:hypothetical protein